jgi:hypothetical protein
MNRRGTNVQEASVSWDILLCEPTRHRNIEVRREVYDVCYNAVPSLHANSERATNTELIILTSVTPYIRIDVFPVTVSVATSRSIC